MQYSYIPVLKKPYKLPLGFIIKCIFFLIIVSYLFIELNRQEDIFLSLATAIMMIIQKKPIVYLLIPIVLVWFNWAAEAKKWQILSHKVENISFLSSFKGVLSGLSMGFVAPQTIGEYAGRIVHMGSNKKHELAGAIFLGSFIQCCISLIFGFWGAGAFLQKQSILFNVSAGRVEISIVLVASLLLFCVVFLKVLPNLRVSIMKFIVSNFKVVSSFSVSEIFQLVFFSILRYLIFITQFVIVLILFDVNLPLQVLISGVTWIFAAKTVIPAFNFLSDIGVREFSALLFFNQYQVDTLSIIIASLFIWAINILAPTIVGSFLLLRMKLKR